MAIMKQIQWTGKEFSGYVDIETNPNSEHPIEAKEVLVFMLVAINGHWKIPVGYFCINGLDGEGKAKLIHRLLEFVEKTGVVITSVTFDGAQSNLSMANKLGANFEDPYCLQTYFCNPFNNGKVFIYLDTCHMLKLVRNCLGTVKNIEDNEGNVISWDYIQKLVEFQINEGLHAGTKIKRRHMQWFREKMKVKIAAQTLSNSVANALTFLDEDLNLEQFRGAAATSKFAMIFNNLFDIFNSQSRLAKYKFKQALSEENIEAIIDYLTYCKEYILGLKVEGVSVLKIRRKTGFLGFLISIESLLKFYQQYVIDQNLLKYVLTYKFSQDHLEIFFSAVRSKGGHSNNPTALQFKHIYKRLLVRCEVKGSEHANAISVDATSILFVPSTITKSATGEDLLGSGEFLQLCSEVDDINFFSSSAWHLTTYTSDIVSYISGFVVKCLKKCVTCQKCLVILEGEESLSKLQIRKKYGNLMNASSFVVGICQRAEKCLKLFLIKSSVFNKKFLIEHMSNKTVQNLPENFYNVFGDHIFDNDPLNNHPMQLIKLILKKYFNIRLHHEASKLKDMSVQNRVRSILTKTILFKNQ